MWVSHSLQKLMHVLKLFPRSASISINLSEDSLPGEKETHCLASGRANEMEEETKSQHPKIMVPTQTKVKTKDPLLPLMWKLIEDSERKDMKRYSDVPVIFHRRVTEMVKYNLEGALRFTPVSIRQAYKLLEDPSKVTPEKLHLADIMECCLLIAIALATSADDIVDESKMRYGKPCWYTLAPSTQVALNDSWVSCFLHARIVREQLTGTPFYPRALEILEEFYYETLMGQYFDLIAFGNINLDHCTMEYVKMLGHYKMAPGIILKPLALALLLTGEDPTDEAIAREDGNKIGFLYQVQNDYMDCYGSEEYGKIGTDIEDGKATWLIAKALELANEQQRDVLRQNYGKKNPVAVLRVKQVYDEINLHDVYLEFAEQFYSDMEKNINKLPNIGKVHKYALDQLFSGCFH